MEIESAVASRRKLAGNWVRVMNRIDQPKIATAMAAMKVGCNECTCARTYYEIDQTSQPCVCGHAQFAHTEKPPRTVTLFLFFCFIIFFLSFCF